MPFPTRQGTQAAVRAMMDALARAHAGEGAHLLTYAAAEHPIDPPFTLHRISGFVDRGDFRSGPSLAKLVQDVELVPAIVRLASKLVPDVVVAHHVEAAMACMAARARPLVFFAHTALGPELPTYAPPILTRALGAAGERLDATLVRRADAVAAISPALADALARDAGVGVTYVPTPWTVPAPRTDEERIAGRREAGLPEDADVLLYSGNLDRYQGWEHLIRALACVRESRPRAWLLVTTASDPTALVTEAVRSGVTHRLRVVKLGDEAARRRAHAAADVAIVTRKSPGGLPIKLLDALARGVPTVVPRRGTAGIDLGGAARVVDDDDPEALARGALDLLGAPAVARAMGESARTHVLGAHSASKFVEAFDQVVAQARAAAAKAS
jgi:glycosyltransferase involved in cell wall biosynthesis